MTNGVIYGTAPYGGSGNSGVIYSMLTNGTGFKILHSFTGADGSEPAAGVFLSGNTLYGTAAAGGSHGNGALFSLGTDGTKFTVLHVFGPETGTAPDGVPTNIDGVGPWGPMILWSNRLYGTTVWGGSSGKGTVFSLDTNGSDFTTLHSFVQATDREGPQGALIPIGGRLVGAAEGLGLSPSGSLFSLNPDGSGFNVLYAFPGYGTYVRGLVSASNVLYGVALHLPEGIPPTGAVFRVEGNGSVTNLCTFSFPINQVTNYGGNDPVRGPLAFGSNTLYGANHLGGVNANGTVYSLKPDGTEFKVLYSFFGGDGGGIPFGTVTLSDNTLYGTTFHGGKSDYGTIFSIALVPIPLPVISSQPVSHTNLAGTVVAFAVTASGQAPVSYQWLKSNNPLPQRVSPTLTLTNISDLDAGTYSVIVSNGGGVVVSAPVNLVVLDPPAISAQPASRTNIAGTTGSFSVSATGTSPLKYQWLKGPLAIANQTNSSLTLTNISDGDVGSYSVIVTNIVGKISSAAATLVVMDPPRITKQPLNQTNFAETTASFSVSATGTDPLRYQWLKGNTQLPQQQKASLTLLTVSDADTASYKVVITNIAGSITSAPASLIVIDLPQLSAIRVAQGAVLSWPTGLAGYDLQWTTNLAAPVWSTNGTAPVILNGQNTVTSPISAPQQFFRLGK